MKKFGEIICKYRKIILIVAILLMIPTIIGIKATRINYDILVYLPDNIETIKGENILSDEFNMGAFSVIILENMPSKEIIKLEKDIRKIDNVAMVLSTADVIGDKLPVEMLPDDIKDIAYKENSTIMLATFKDAISSDETLETIQTLRDMTDKRVKISGMSAVLIDTKELSDQEITIYVGIAVILCLIILQLALDSYFAPILLLLNVGFAILYNMGSNVFLGETSYITKAISAVLQLGVTMDFAIFLYHSYMEEKKTETDINEAMATAISKTLVSVAGSSLTTIAGFLALCSMSFSLGKDIGLVMAKGVFFGVICVVTILPAMILEFNTLIEKTKHKEVMPKFRHLKEFVMKHYKLAIILFIVILPFAYNGYKKTEVYYKLDSSLPENLDSISANNELKDKFGMVSTEMILIDKNVSDEKINEMLDKVDKIEGIEWTLSLSKISKLGIPKMMIPNEVLEKLENENYSLIILNSKYEIA